MIRDYVYIIVLSWGTVFPCYCYGQLSPSTDSLKSTVANVTGEDRVEVLLELSAELRRSNIDSAITYAEKALAASELEAGTYLKAESHRNLGWLLTSDNENPEALKHLLEAKSLFEQSGNLEKEAVTLQGLGYLYRSQSNYGKALEYYFSALSLEEQLENKQGIADNLYWLGFINKQLDQAENAIRFHERALEIGRELNDANTIAQNATHLGNLYAATGATEQALSTLKEALTAAEQLPGAHAKATILMNISSVYNDKHSYRQALDANNQALALAREMSDHMLESLALENMGSLYRSQGNLSRANTYLQQSLPLLYKIGWQQTTMEVQNQLAQNYLDLNRVDEAIGYASTSLDSALKIRSFENARLSLQILSEAYQQMEDYEQAVQAQQQMIAITDSLLNKEQTRQIAEMQTRYETKQKEQEIALLEAKQERAVLLRNALVGGLILMVIIGVLIYNRQRLKIKKNSAELENTRLKEIQLKQDLNFKNKQLTTHSLNLVQKNETMKELKEQINSIRKKKNVNIDRELQSLQNMVDYSFNLDEDWKEFRLYFEEVHTGFFDTLKEEYPDLTPKEHRLSALVKLNLTTKEIATLLGITPDSVKTARYRLRKKLDIQTGENLTDFMIDIEKEASARYRNHKA